MHVHNRQIRFDAMAMRDPLLALDFPHRGADFRFPQTYESATDDFFVRRTTPMTP